ncbi:hypothetical protein AAFF_G00233740 [Aldrovandia affinis]|uniref:Protein-tyrosine phosphatase receptor IA-2 ectodomain domain-containing protein n=1 Tax=Aldrovandia affinis TaxID=143900 RepID=A0AAD7RES1_9TELE|nr:hypothetical protein AAFF_G00233740 [Aldrovandia affinis]
MVWLAKRQQPCIARVEAAEDFVQTPETSPADTSGLSRLAGLSDSRDRKLKPEEVELGRSLQKYLQQLGLLPQSAPPTGPWPSGQKPLRQKDGSQVGRLGEYHQPQAPGKGRGKALLPVFTPGPSGQPDGRLLLLALQQYLERERESGQHGGPPLPYSGRSRPLLRTQVESVGPREGLGAYLGRASFQPEGATPQRTPADRPLFKTPSGQSAAKDPLTMVDEKFIQNVVKQLGKHNVNVDALSGPEMDQLADVIADALQVVDKADMKRGPPSVTQPDQQEALQGDGELQEQQTGDEKPNSSDKDAGLVSKLLEYLDRSSLGDAPTPARQVHEDGRGMGVGPAVGVENVKSRTTRKDLTLQKKDSMPAEGEGDVPALPVAMTAILAEPQKKDMRVEQELRLDVKTVSTAEREDDYGYITTDSDPLPTDAGVHLMEVLAHSFKLQMTDFFDLTVEDSAVTFKVRPNPQNVSTADVVAAAGRA